MKRTRLYGGSQRSEELVDRHHVSSERVYARLTRWRRFQIKFWAALAEWCEANWLTANGWTKVRNGWLLPDWHPRKINSVLRRSPNRNQFNLSQEPYDQNHAVNSHRYHAITIQNPAPKRIVKLPPYPAYVRWGGYQAWSFIVALALFASSTILQNKWFLLAMWGWSAVCLCLAKLVQRDLELDFTEHKLRGSNEQAKKEVHGMHPPSSG